MMNIEAYDDNKIKTIYVVCYTNVKNITALIKNAFQWNKIFLMHCDNEYVIGIDCISSEVSKIVSQLSKMSDIKEIIYEN